MQTFLELSYTVVHTAGEEIALGRSLKHGLIGVLLQRLTGDLSQASHAAHFEVFTVLARQRVLESPLILLNLQARPSLRGKSHGSKDAE